MDPWQDYLALPVAPMLLLVQGAALFVDRRPLRWTLLLAVPVAIAAMLVYVAALPAAPDAGANIGAGVLFLWLIVSSAIVAAGVVREGVGAAAARVARSRGDPAPPSPEPRAGVTAPWSKAATAGAILFVIAPLQPLLLLPVVATIAAWVREPPSRLRIVATALAGVAVVYAFL